MAASPAHSITLVDNELRGLQPNTTTTTPPYPRPTSSSSSSPHDEPDHVPPRPSDAGADVIVVAPIRQTSDWRWFVCYTSSTWLLNAAWVLLLLRKVVCVVIHGVTNTPRHTHLNTPP